MKTARNFWIKLSLDGKSKPIIAGTRGKRGGFELKIFARGRNNITMPVKITGSTEDSTGRRVLFLEEFVASEPFSRQPLP